jgi:tetratricopeptide (TPR) repeat protein
MILTQCAVCATDLGLTLGKKCGRCSTRYCGPECQVQHWKEGGHDKLCKTIKKAGGAEQYNANKKYSEAISVAAEACAEDTKGQTCYICTQALHWKTKEGLVRGCACRGTAGFVHLSCLAEQAKILVAEGLENNLAFDERWARWHMCSLCEQQYHGVVKWALGWACWKTYLSRPESDTVQFSAMRLLGNGLSNAGHDEEALSVREAELSTLRRFGGTAAHMLVVQGNLATTYKKIGRIEEALNLYRDVYSGELKLYGAEDRQTLISAYNYAIALLELQRFDQAKSLLRQSVCVARRVLGENVETTLKLRWIYAAALYEDPNAALDDLREAVATLEETTQIARRVLGAAHPVTAEIMHYLRDARATLSTRGTRVEEPGN